MPVRRLPHIGEYVTVAFFAATVQGVIGAIDGCFTIGHRPSLRRVYSSDRF